ncbi:MAG: hypothetical protein Q4F72_09260 [Desulfovibrionaceae bacterium]|nr:hypothetical protein [Desulfovibrionaceae bacterium]
MQGARDGSTRAISMQEDKPLSAGAARYVNMDPEELKRLNTRAAAALKAVNALAGDASVFENGTGRVLDPSRLPAETAELLEKEPWEIAESNFESLRLALYLLDRKTAKAMDIQDIRKGAAFNQAACRLLFDRKPAARGSLSSLFGKR